MADEMEQPGIVKIRDQYFLKVYDILIELHSCNLRQSIAFLVAMYYILDEKYPKELFNVFIFFEKFVTTLFIC